MAPTGIRYQNPRLNCAYPCMDKCIEVLVALTFRTFFSNISYLFRNSMNDVFCTKQTCIRISSAVSRVKQKE